MKRRRSPALCIVSHFLPQAPPPQPQKIYKAPEGETLLLLVLYILRLQQVLIAFHLSDDPRFLKKYKKLIFSFHIFIIIILFKKK